MAKFNEILAGRYNRLFQKLLSMKGPPPASQLASEIMAIFPLFFGAEMRYLEGWNRYANAIQVTAVAAQNSIIRHRNPAGSNVIAVFEKILYMTTIAGGGQPQLSHSTLNTDLGTIVTPSNPRLDSRGNQSPTLIESKGNAAGIATTVIEIGANAVNTSYDFIWYENQEITLLPGDVLELSEGVVNQTFTGSFVWRERSLEDSEKT